MAERREGYGDYLIATWNPMEFEEYRKIFDEYYVDYDVKIKASFNRDRFLYAIIVRNEPDYILKEIRQKIKELKKPWILRVGM